MGGASVIEADILAGRAILLDVRSFSRAVRQEVREAMDMAELELMLEREAVSPVWSCQKVPIESSSSPNVLRWREGRLGSGQAGAIWSVVLPFFLTGGRM